MILKGLPTLDEKQIKENWEGFEDFLHKRVSGITTGISGLDREVCGLRGIVCIRGAPGTNKSTLCLQISNHYSRTHGPVLFYDRENGKNRLKLRLICQELECSEVDLITGLRSKTYSSDVCRKKLDIPFYVLTTGTLQDIEENIIALQNIYKKPVLLVLDSLQKMPIDLSNRRDSIDRWLYGLDDLKVAHEQNLRIIFTSEKSYRGYNDPALGGSKDSSEIEYASENIWDLRHSSNKGKIVLNVAKDRDGNANFEFELEKVMSSPTNPRSFCYKLKEVDQDGQFDFST